MRNKIITAVFVLLLFCPTISYAKGNIIINIPSRTLEVYDNDIFIKQFRIAVGRPSYDSPIGRYHVISKQINPVWSPKGQKPIQPGPDNPLGIRWIGFYSEYGIHGNNNPKSIGTFASKGCIRMYNYDVKEVYDLVDIGSKVDIYYNTIHTFIYPDSSKNVLIVYPDLYNKGASKISKVNNKLKEIGLANQIRQEKLNKLYENINKSTTVFSKNWTLFINGQLLSSDTLIYSNKDNEERENLPTYENVFVNINSVNSFLGIDLKVADNKVIYDGRDIYFEMHNDVAYICILDAIRTIEGYYLIEENQEKIDWIISFGKSSGNFFRLDIKTDDKNIYVRLRELLKEIKIDYEIEEEKNKVTIDGEEISGKLINNEIYISQSQIKDYFGIDTRYDSFSNMLELIDTNKKSN